MYRVQFNPEKVPFLPVKVFWTDLWSWNIIQWLLYSDSASQTIKLLKFQKCIICPMSDVSITELYGKMLAFACKFKVWYWASKIYLNLFVDLYRDSKNDIAFVIHQFFLLLFDLMGAILFFNLLLYTHGTVQQPLLNQLRKTGRFGRFFFFWIEP